MYKAKRTTLALALAAAVVTLSACGGGDPAYPGSGKSSQAESEAAIAAAPAPVTSAAAVITAPLFHRQPDSISAPGLEDEAGFSLSAYSAPRNIKIAADVESLSTRGLTDERVAKERYKKLKIAPLAAPSKGTAVVPVVGPVVYTAAQIRAAYGLPLLPASYTNLSASAAAALGAGQTVYVLDAQDNPNAVSDLAVFSTKFGLPVCAEVAIDPNSVLPLLAAPLSGCTISKVFTVANSSAMTGVAPAYDAGWAAEIALDIQWVHAIAPLARIVLIETPDAGVPSLSQAVVLANRMGPGVVSMSFGVPEGSWALSYDSMFSGAGMSYFAATGDSGNHVLWPSVSPNVIGVGGTTLAYSGSGSRSETAWSLAGGGVSAIHPVSAWQKLTLPTAVNRTVADVAMNANPNSGQYVYLTAPGAATGGWYAYGGTSMSTPMWAGLAAVANAQRALLAKPSLGATLATVLYTKAGVGTRGYTTNFLDVKSGSNGTCSLCTAATGFDVPTGLGTPNARGLLPVLQAN